jgi:Tol biopolymer transport system component
VARVLVRAPPRRLFALVITLALLGGGCEPFGDTTSPPTHIYTMRADGTQQAALTPLDGHAEGAPAWSPDGTRIAFTRDGRTWLMDADGSHPERLTGGASFFPAWSPDGTRIAYAHTTQIWVADVDGSKKVRLAVGADPQEGGPVWSPDGASIAFVGKGGIHVVNADEGSGDTVLKPFGWNPAWSPDGRWIAYWTDEIYLVRADGSSSRRLTHTPHREERRPSWSPDGTRIAFAARRVKHLDGPWNLYVMDSDGSDVTQIGIGAHPDRGVDNGGGLLRWSPNGTEIAFTCRSEICVAAADGSAVRRLTPSVGRDGEPEWSPDGTRIVFQSEH